VKRILIRDVSVYYSNHYQSQNTRGKRNLKQYFYSIKLRLPLAFCDCFIFQIDNGLSNKPKRFLLKYVSHYFGSADSN